MSSNLFELYLPLNNSSKFYRRLGGILCVALFFIAIKCTDPPLLIGVIIGLCLSYAIWHFYRCDCPHPTLLNLRLERECWIIEDYQSCCTSYAVMRIVVDTGFYVVLHLSEGVCRPRLLVVFYDQISSDELRQLNRLTKIKKTNPK